MKSKLILLCLMGVISLSLLACSPVSTEEPVSPAPNKVYVEVTCDDFMNQKHISKQFGIQTGGSLMVALCSNPTTGFLWSETAQITAQTVLEQVDHEFVSPQHEPPPPPGTPGQEIWTFKALNKGTSTVSMEYSRPWEGAEKAEWTFVLTVVVK